MNNILYNAKAAEITNYSNPDKVAELTKKYFGYDKAVYLSNKKDKKYMIQDDAGKFIHFGAFGMEDFTKHKDLLRRRRYLARATKIKGNWKDNPYSPNNLSISLLWNN